MKNLLMLVLVLIMMFVFTACGDEKINIDGGTEPSEGTIETEPDFNSSVTDSMAETLVTEYTVEDYLDNAIIVSKNDGLLYGLIDNTGKEIIPVKYDDMEFFNKEDYINGYYDNYIWCKYESTEYIFNLKGEEIMQNEANITYADSVFKTENAPFFNVYNSQNSIITIYDQKLNLIGKVEEKVENIKKYNMVFISDKCYFYSSLKVESTGTYSTSAETIGSCLSDYNGNIKRDFGNQTSRSDYYFYENKCVLLFDDFANVSSFSSSLNTKTVHIDINGNVVKEEKIEYQEAVKKYKNEKKKYNFYQSNSTYKMEDLNGDPLYVERYYKELEVEGENDCHFLTDENDNVCIFGSQGNLYCEFGDFINKDGDLYLQTQDGDEKIEKVYEGKNSIAIMYEGYECTQIKFYY